MCVCADAPTVEAPCHSLWPIGRLVRATRVTHTCQARIGVATGFVRGAPPTPHRFQSLCGGAGSAPVGQDCPMMANIPPSFTCTQLWPFNLHLCSASTPPPPVPCVAQQQHGSGAQCRSCVCNGRVWPSSSAVRRHDDDASHHQVQGRQSVKAVKGMPLSHHCCLSHH